VVAAKLRRNTLSSERVPLAVAVAALKRCCVFREMAPVIVAKEPLSACPTERRAEPEAVAAEADRLFPVSRTIDPEAVASEALKDRKNVLIWASVPAKVESEAERIRAVERARVADCVALLAEIALPVCLATAPAIVDSEAANVRRN
jgi:hypothetical protein